MKRAIAVAVLVLALPAFAEDSQTRLEDILSGKDEKKDSGNENKSTSSSSSSSSSSSGSNSGSSLVSSGPVSQSFSLLTGRTVGAGKNVLGANYRGVLGLDGFFLHGIGDIADIGARVGLNLAWFEGWIPSFGYFAPVVGGLRFQGVLRFRFVESGRISFGMSFEPGLFFYFPSAYSIQVGILLPVEAMVGIALSSAFNIAVGLQVPLFITGPTGGGAGGPYMGFWHVVVPILAGGGIEYFVRSDLMLFGKVHFGPSINHLGIGGAALAADIRVGIGWKF